MTLQILLQLVGGLIFLVAGGELLVRGAARLAAAAGVSPLVIGLTVVAFGTSAPELAVSLQAGLSGNADIAIANVVGSNIFNILFIIGLCAVLVPLVVNQQLVRLDIPIMVGVSLLFYILALDGSINRLDALLLFVGIVGYTVWGIRESRKETAAVAAEYAQEYSSEALDKPPLPAQQGVAGTLVSVGLILGGLVVLVGGSRLLVAGATALARALGVSDVVIGLTIIAIGTSLPEVATSLIATLRAERDIAIGNVVGSNIFNLLSILGLAGLLTPGGLAVSAGMLRVDILVMIGTAIACMPIFFKGEIRRWEGILFLASYVLYTLYLILSATSNPSAVAFNSALLTYGVPVIALAVLFAGWQTLQLFGTPADESGKPSA